jgi:hypothetical protein
MIAEPKPPSGISAEASWHRQLLRWVKGWFVISIEGYRITETSNGRVFKKESIQPPQITTKGAGSSVVNGQYAGNWNPGQVYAPGAIVRNLNPTVVLNTVTYNITPGIFGCVLETSAGGIGVNLPVYPEITGACWQLIAFAPMSVNVCSSGSKVIYIQSSEAF